MAARTDVAHRVDLKLNYCRFHLDTITVGSGSPDPYQDHLATECWMTALTSIQQELWSHPSTFRFEESVVVCLKSFGLYKDLQEIADILREVQGQSYIDTATKIDEWRHKLSQRRERAQIIQQMNFAPDLVYQNLDRFWKLDPIIVEKLVAGLKDNDKAKQFISFDVPLDIRGYAHFVRRLSYCAHIPEERKACIEFMTLSRFHDKGFVPVSSHLFHKCLSVALEAKKSAFVVGMLVQASQFKNYATDEELCAVLRYGVEAEEPDIVSSVIHHGNFWRIERRDEVLMAIKDAAMGPSTQIFQMFVTTSAFSALPSAEFFRILMRTVFVTSNVHFEVLFRLDQFRHLEKDDFVVLLKAIILSENINRFRMLTLSLGFYTKTSPKDLADVLECVKPTPFDNVLPPESVLKTREMARTLSERLSALTIKV